MIKTYKLNMQMNSARIILEGKSGNKVVYEFTGGNVITSTPAKLTLCSKYDQDLLEASEAFKKKAIFLARVQKTPEEIEAEKKALETAEEEEENGNEVVENVTSVVEAINYCAEKWGEVVKTAKQAKAAAEAHGVEFPNLKVGKGK